MVVQSGPEEYECSIYEDRPDMCRVDVVGPLIQLRYGKTKEQTDDMQNAACDLARAFVKESDDETTKQRR